MTTEPTRQRVRGQVSEALTHAWAVALLGLALAIVFHFLVPLLTG